MDKIVVLCPWPYCREEGVEPRSTRQILRYSEVIYTEDLEEMNSRGDKQYN